MEEKQKLIDNSVMEACEFLDERFNDCTIYEFLDFAEKLHYSQCKIHGEAYLRGENERNVLYDELLTWVSIFNEERNTNHNPYKTVLRWKKRNENISSRIS